MKRYSKQREMILDYLKGTKSHPTAEQIYSDLKAEVPSLSLATVYRNLNLLCDSGIIIKLDTGETVDRFDADTNNHYHFICEGCNNVSDVFKDTISNSTLERSLEKGFSVSYHKLYIYGLCDVCNNKNL